VTHPSQKAWALSDCPHLVSMQQFYALVCLLAVITPLIGAEQIIGFDGKEHHYPVHRDGLHDSALHHLHPSHHMLNEKPIIVDQRNLHITKDGRRVSQHGFGEGTSTKSKTRTRQHESATSLSKGKAIEAHPGVRVQFHGGYKEDMKILVPSGLGGPAPATMAAPAPSAASIEGPMDEDKGTPEQGFSGEAVEHTNMKTVTEDWHGEYGPDSGHQSYREICALYPDNKWCHLRGYHRPTPKPSGVVLQASSNLIITSIVLACMFWA